MVEFYLDTACKQKDLEVVVVVDSRCAIAEPAQALEAALAKARALSMSNQHPMVDEATKLANHLRVQLFVGRYEVDVTCPQKKQKKTKANKSSLKSFFGSKKRGGEHVILQARAERACRRRGEKERVSTVRRAALCSGRHVSVHCPQDMLHVH